MSRNNWKNILELVERETDFTNSHIDESHLSFFVVSKVTNQRNGDARGKGLALRRNQSSKVSRQSASWPFRIVLQLPERAKFRTKIVNTHNSLEIADYAIVSCSPKFDAILFARIRLTQLKRRIKMEKRFLSQHFYYNVIYWFQP